MNMQHDTKGGSASAPAKPKAMAGVPALKL